MKLSDYLDNFYIASGKASDVARTAAFAGIALIWVFKIDTRGEPSLPIGLLIPTIFFASALVFDLLQYVLSTIIWGSFHRYHEKRLKKSRKNPTLSHEPYLTWPIWGSFILKIVAVGAGYIFVARYLFCIWGD